jgi:hypothetical protein
MSPFGSSKLEPPDILTPFSDARYCKTFAKFSPSKFRPAEIEFDSPKATAPTNIERERCGNCFEGPLGAIFLQEIQFTKI